jgi:hypothetical protein
MTARQIQQAIPHGHNVVPVQPKRQKLLSQGQRRAPANLDPTPEGLDLGRLHVKEHRLRAGLQGFTGTLEHVHVLHAANTKRQQQHQRVRPRHKQPPGLRCNLCKDTVRQRLKDTQGCRHRLLEQTTPNKQGAQVCIATKHKHAHTLHPHNERRRHHPVHHSQSTPQYWGHMVHN